MFDVLKVFIKRTARVATQVFGLVIISLPVFFHLEENNDQGFRSLVLILFPTALTRADS